MMTLPRRRFLQLAGAIALLPHAARAQAYPSRPVRLIVPFPPGGQIDIVARLAAQWLSDQLGQQFFVDNRPGAGGNLGAAAVVRAPADGHTLLMASAANAVNETLYEGLGFNFIRDTVPVAGISRIPLVLETHPAFPFQTVSGLIAYARANPRRIDIATPTTGTAPFMAAELFKMMSGIDLVHVPYRGEAQMLIDLLGGQVQLAFGGISTSIEQIKAGKLRALGVGTAGRTEELPQTPAIGESVPGFEASGWCGIVAPRSTPAEIVERLAAAINVALGDPGFRARLAEAGVAALSGSPAEFGKLVVDEAAKWGKVVKFANLKPEQ
jgi:tripartite-type tricarboxylate transporter receptor subunit TctC